MIYSFDLEMQLLAGLIKYPEIYTEIATFISEKDFWNESAKINRVVFKVLKQAIENGEKVDEIVIAQRVKSLGISFEENINPADYIDSLALRKVSKDTVVTTAKELKKYTIRREIYYTAVDMGKKMRSMPAASDYSTIISTADQIYNSQINMYETGIDKPVDLYEKMADLVEERGNNPIEEFGYVGPHPRLHQVYGSLLRPGNITVVVARSGAGKMLTNSSKILTPDGWKTHGTIKVNDKVICPDGSVSNVSGVFPQGKKDIYRVTFKDGRTVDCGEEHLWKIFARNNKGVYSWMTVNTKVIEDHLTHPTKKVYVPLVQKIDLGNTELPIDPYVLGVLLGDGDLSYSSNASVTTADDELYNKVNSIYKCGKKTIKNGTTCYNFRILIESSVMENIKKLGLFKTNCFTKFIPEIYKNASFEQRKALLQGLMDTDGTLSRAGGTRAESNSWGCLEYSTSGERLAKDVQELIWSLGGISPVTSRFTKYTHKGEKKTGARSYRVRARFRDPKMAFSLSRKKDKLGDTYQYSDLKLRVVSVEKLPQQEECTCIMVDHPDHLYVTDNYIVTHNTQFALDFLSKSSFKYNVPILHFDNGEMSEEETIMRQCAALSGVPFYLLESGNWRKAGIDVVNKVRDVWAKIKKNKLYYYNVGGMAVDAQINLLKRFYYSEIGRGNPLLFNFDYIKTTYENTSSGKNEWQIVGEMVDKYKKCIQREIVNEKGPLISMMTAVQSNRAGITNNKQSANVVDDESIVSLSDRITQFSSHMFILRNKTADEIQNEKGFGTHKLICVKARHLGKDVFGAINPVKMPDGSMKKNFFNLDFSNFAITEKGDLRDLVDSLSANATLASSGGPDDVPSLD